MNGMSILVSANFCVCGGAEFFRVAVGLQICSMKRKLSGQVIVFTLNSLLEIG